MNVTFFSTSSLFVPFCFFGRQFRATAFCRRRIEKVLKEDSGVSLSACDARSAPPVVGGGGRRSRRWAVIKQSPDTASIAVAAAAAAGWWVAALDLIAR